MTAATNLRSVLMVSAASVALYACSSSGGGDDTPDEVVVDVSFATEAQCTGAGLVLSDPITVNGLLMESCAIDGLELGGTIDGSEDGSADGVLTLPYIASSSAPFGSVPILIQGVTKVGDGDANPAILEIEAGAVIAGAFGPDVIVVDRGSQIIANGTAEAPIIMTSAADLLDEASAGGASPRTGSSLERGEWGGVVINGYAPINDCDPTQLAEGADPADPAVTGTADCVKEGEGNSGYFGGGDADDASGVMRYVQLKYAGYEFDPDNELNGVAFQGVGRGVSPEAAAVLGAGEVPFEYIQVHNNDDDGIEWFGGTVNGRYLVVTGAGDDSFDWTDGWTGNVQFGLIKHANGEGDNGFEGDNRGGDFDVTPRSRPTFSNITFVGDEDLTSGRALRLRAGTGGLIANSIFIKSTDDCMQIDTEQDDASASGVDLLATNILNLESVLFDCATNFSDDDADTPEVEAEIAFNADSPFFVDTTSSTVLVDGALVAEGDPINTNVADSGNTLAETYFPGPTEFAVPVLDLTATGNGFDNQNGDGEPGVTGVTDGFETTAAGDGFDASFFTSVNYIGAFGYDDQPDSNWATGWTFGVFDDAAGNCPAGTINTSQTIADAFGNASQPVCRLQGTITSDITLTEGNVYQLNGVVTVGEDIGVSGGDPSGTSAVLTIEPGVTVYGVNGPDVLVVARGSQIIANGTEAKPIVFTSDEDLNGENTIGDERGQFGGIVINGQAPINDCDSDYGSDSTSAGTGDGGTDLCVKDGEGNSGFFGGSIADDASGVLRYVQVRYAGFKFTPQNELNGVAFQGVGNGVSTQAAAVLGADDEPFEYIHVHNNDDDGVEFFGGTVNARYLVLTGNGDDSLDWTDGWNGNVQYVVIEQGNGEGDNAFEGDNRGRSPTNTPTSDPKIANVTIVGGSNIVASAETGAGNRGLRLREGTNGELYNFIIHNTPDAAIYLDREQESGTTDGAGGSLGDGLSLVSGGLLTLDSAFISSVESFDGDSSEADGDGAAAELLFTSGTNNVEGAASASTLAGFTFLTNNGIGLIPSVGGPEDAVVAADLSGNAFFETVDFIGAVAPGTADGDAWFSGWTFVDAESFR